MGEATVQMEGKWVSGHQACQPKGPDSPSILRLLVVAPWETSWNADRRVKNGCRHDHLSQRGVSKICALGEHVCHKHR